MAEVIDVVDDAFEREVLQASGPVLVDFHRSGCAPCRAIAPAIEELAVKYEAKLKIVRVDVAKAPAATLRFGVLGVPTLMLVRDGKEVMRVVGALPRAVLGAQVEQALA